MKYLSLCLLLPLTPWVVAQNTPSEGIYRAKELKEFSLRLYPDHRADALMASGRYTLDDKKLTVAFNEGNSFSLRRLSGNSPELELHFRNDDSSVSPRYIYIGYENSQGEVTYVCLHNKVQDDEHLTLSIPRTEKLYLVNAYRIGISGNPKEAVRIETFSIGKQTNALEISIDPEKAMSSSLEFLYNSENETLTLTDRSLSDKPVVFSKVQPSAADLLLPTTTESAKNWKHLIAFQEETDIPAYDPDRKSPVAPLVVARTLSAAIASAKTNNRLLWVFQTTDAAAKQKFENLVQEYRETNEGNFACELYLASAKEQKALRTKGLPSGNQLAVLDATGHLLYHQPTTIPEAKTLLFNSYYTDPLATMARAHQLDLILGNPKTPTVQLLKVFAELLKQESPKLYLLAKHRPKTTDSEAETESETDTIDYIAEEASYFLSELKNPEAVYRMQLTPEQLTAQWKRCVAAYNNQPFNPQYAFALALNNTASYFSKVFNTEDSSLETEVQTIGYLLKHYSDIKAYNEKLLGKDSEGEFSYQERLDKGSIEADFPSLASKLDQVVFKNKELLPKVKPLFAEAVKNHIFTPDTYIDFLYENDDVEMETVFSNYFNELQQKDPNLIAALDQVYTEDGGYSWKYYKMRFANRANNIAWKVYEMKKNNAEALAAPYQWAKAAVQLEPKNPYYLDTLAHLLYARGQYREAIATQEKAVAYLQEADESNEEEQQQVKAHLDKMKQMIPNN
ncbi:MAG: hypothetical protein ACTTJI_03090 [Capnocytophaga sp.]|uniref:hypothetical protein n=1 Tax=Capnocytophaga sp. TaxID=44737 RepID=UPI003FA0EFBC